MKAAVASAVTVLVIVLATAQASVGQSFVLPSVASLHHPVNVSLTTYGVILSYRYNDSATLLARLDANGTLQQFAPSFSGSQEVYLAESNGSADFHAGDLFLCSSDSIYRMAAGSTAAILFARPSPASAVEYIAFDGTGAWGHLLFALTGDGGVWAVNASGSSKLVTNLGANLMPEGVTVAPAGFGLFGGDLLVSMENSHSVVAIAKNDTGTPTTLATFPGEAPERVIIDVPGRDLLIAKYDQNAVVDFPAKELAGYAGLPIVITEGENGQTGSINILNATGKNVAVTTLFSDPTSPHFEGAAFIPQGSVALMTTTASSSTTINESTNSVGTSAPVPWAAVFASVFGVALVASVVLIYLKRRR